jgi:uncharacterized protein DUF3574/putative peptidoglycan binding protein
MEFTMNKITFPLKPQMTNAEVVDLQQALALLGLEVSDRENANHHYGPTTRAAVRKLQLDHQLSATGIVDEATANLLNRLLVERGVLNDPAPCSATQHRSNRRKQIMMNRFLKKQYLGLILLMASLMAPAAFAQGQAAISASAQASAQDNTDRQKLFQASPFIRTELYFGRNKPDGTEVSRKEFDKFLSGFVTERFPDGLTVLTGRGQFLNSEGEVERERSVVLILLYPVSARNEKSIKIEEIREEYKRRFRQQSVLRVDDPLPVWVSF